MITSIVFKLKSDICACRPFAHESVLRYEDDNDTAMIGVRCKKCGATFIVDFTKVKWEAEIEAKK